MNKTFAISSFVIGLAAASAASAFGTETDTSSAALETAYQIAQVQQIDSPDTQKSTTDAEVLLKKKTHSDDSNDREHADDSNDDNGSDDNGSDDNGSSDDSSSDNGSDDNGSSDNGSDDNGGSDNGGSDD